MITLTDSATRKLAQIIDSNAQFRGKALRLYIQGGGCSGLSYGFDFTDESLDGDAEFVFGPVKVWVDDRSMAHLEGSVVDFIDGPQAAGFQIKNPRGQQKCGCGSAGSGKH